MGQVAAEVALTYDGQLGFIYEHALNGFSIKLADGQVERLARDRRVNYVEENGQVWPTGTQTNPPWGLDRIDQRDDLNGTYVWNTRAPKVHVYVIDSGIRASHNDFGGRVTGGKTFVNDGRGTGDCSGHGTHVAGTIGGNTWGVAKRVRLHPVRVFGCTGGAPVDRVIAAVDWVTSRTVSPRVANMSLSGPASDSLDSAVKNSMNDGVTYAVAAGNGNQDACNVSPARVGKAITVGSMIYSCSLTACGDSRSSFSNWGTCVNIFAPGELVKSAWYTSDTATNTISGTSMASPHVAGVAALYLANHPGASAQAVKKAIIDTSTKGRLSNLKGSPNRLVYSLLQGDG